MHNRKHAAFLRELAYLLELYEAEISYTTHDDGIHLTVSGKQIFVGFLDRSGGPDAVGNLRAVADEWEAR